MEGIGLKNPSRCHPLSSADGTVGDADTSATPNLDYCMDASEVHLPSSGGDDDVGDTVGVKAKGQGKVKFWPDFVMHDEYATELAPNGSSITCLACAHAKGRNGGVIKMRWNFATANWIDHCKVPTHVNAVANIIAENEDKTKKKKRQSGMSSFFQTKPKRKKTDLYAASSCTANETAPSLLSLNMSVSKSSATESSFIPRLRSSKKPKRYVHAC